MNIEPIQNVADLHATFKRLELVFQAHEGTPQGDKNARRTTGLAHDLAKLAPLTRQPARKTCHEPQTPHPVALHFS